MSILRASKYEGASSVTEMNKDTSYKVKDVQVINPLLQPSGKEKFIVNIPVIKKFFCTWSGVQFMRTSCHIHCRHLLNSPFQEGEKLSCAPLSNLAVSETNKFTYIT